MTTRKSARLRERELRDAVLRLSSDPKSLSVSAVARAVGVTAALVHNHYPAIALEIRQQRGLGDRLEKRKSDFAEEREKNKALRETIKALRKQVRKLTSINETLLTEIDILRGKHNSKVVPLKIK